jgi:hypothetical protein
MTAVDLCRGVAKLVKALDFDSSIRRFDSFHPCQIYGLLPRTLIQSLGIGLLFLRVLVCLSPLHRFNAKHRWTPHVAAQP